MDFSEVICRLRLYRKDETRMLLVVISRPVKHLTLLLDLPWRLVLVLEIALLDSALLSTQEALLESFCGKLNFMPFRKFAIVSILLLIAICL
jgi:hypothetical protein